MKSGGFIKAGRNCAIFSFVLGTFILLMYYISIDSGVAFLGLGFFMLTGLINIIILIILLIRAIMDKPARRQLLLTCGLMLINIPVSIGYMCLGGLISNLMRVHLHNNTKAVITDIHVKGCDDDIHLNKMQPDETYNFTIHIPGDCGLTVDYLQNGKRKEETVQDYITNEGGGNLDYNIGGPNQGI